GGACRVVPGGRPSLLAIPGGRPSTRSACLLERPPVDDAEPLAHQGNAPSRLPAEPGTLRNDVAAVSLPPARQGAVPLAAIERERRVHFVQAEDPHLDGLD